MGDVERVAALTAEAIATVAGKCLVLEQKLAAQTIMIACIIDTASAPELLVSLKAQMDALKVREQIDEGTRTAILETLNAWSDVLRAKIQSQR